MHTEVYTPELSLREASKQLETCPRTLSKDIGIAKLILTEFRQNEDGSKWDISQGIDRFRFWILHSIRYEMRSRKWDKRPNGRKNLKKWMRTNKQQLTRQQFNLRGLNHA